MEFLGIGLPELLVILVLALIVVGPQRLPEIAAQLARFLRAFRRYSARITKEFNETLSDLEKEYEDVKGEWKEVGQGLDEGAREVKAQLKSAGDAASVDEASAPKPPERLPSQ